MIKAANKYNVAFAPVSLSEEVKQKLPIWHHLGVSEGKKILNNDKWAKCQQNKHKITTAGDMADYATKHLPSRHKTRRNCGCEPCKASRRTGCKNPHLCQSAALNEEELNRNEQIKERGDPIMFNPTLTTKEN